jgi:nicotinic acetylcholine receptor
MRWDPARYGGIKALHIPSDLLWTPDLVLYNKYLHLFIQVISFAFFSAAGDPDITIFTDALVSYEGKVFWSPPSIYKSFCPIDISWFPFDSQRCDMKFGAWSYTGYYVDLRQLPKDKDGADVETMENGMDLSFYYL